MKLFKLFLISIIFFSCSSRQELNSHNKFKLKVVKEIEYDVKFPYSISFTGVYYDKTIKQEVYYFGDAVTQKKVVFYNNKKELINTLPLDTIINDGETAGHISVISLDTTLFLTKYTNKIYFLDKKGVCFKLLNLDTLINDKNNLFVYRDRCRSDFYKDNCFYFDIEWRGDNVSNTIENQKEYANYFFNKNRATPHLLKINEVFNNPIAKYLLDSIRTSFSKKGEFLVMSPLYAFVNNKLVVYRTSSNKIYVYPINNVNEKAKKVVEIKSDYITEIGYKPISLSKETITQRTEKASYMAKTFSSVEQIVYDKKSQQYIVIIRHSIKNLSELNKERNWSIIIYDKNFTKLGEILESDKEWVWGNMNYTKQGLLVQNNKNRRKENDNYDPTLYKAAIFEISQ